MKIEMKKLTEKEALLKIEAYCSLAERCCSEVEAKLDNWKVGEEIKKCLIKRLVSENYINEERYCRSFINDKLKLNKWGRIKILQALRHKRIPSMVVEKYLAEIDNREYSEILSKLLAAKKKNIKAADEYQLKGKLLRFASGRGFETEEIMRCLHWTEEDETGN